MGEAKSVEESIKLYMSNANREARPGPGPPTVWTGPEQQSTSALVSSIEKLNKDRNIVIFGETGTGKSSLLNLLVGLDQAKISASAAGSTKLWQYLRVGNLCIYDTPGLAEGNKGVVSRKESRNRLLSLIKSLSKADCDGISLLIMVMKKSVTDFGEEQYKMVWEDVCQTRVPIILVVTNFDFDADPGAWWTANKNHFELRGMKFKAEVMGCTASTNDFSQEYFKKTIQERREQTKVDVLAKINLHALHNGYKSQVAGKWWKFL